MKKIIKGDLTFEDAFKELKQGSEIAFFSWKSETSLRLIDGFIVLFDPARSGSIKTWAPDPIEMMQDKWMVVE